MDSALWENEYHSSSGTVDRLYYRVLSGHERTGTEALNVYVEPTMTFVQGVTLTTGFLAMQVTTAADITRYQTGRKNTLKATLWGTTPGRHPDVGYRHTNG